MTTLHTTLGAVLPGDVLYGLGTGPVESFTIAGVQHLGPLVIVDFADGTATPPVPSTIPVEVRR